jgi:hypothetical protein
MGKPLRVVYTSPSQRAPGGVIALPHFTTPLGPLTRSCDFNKPAEADRPPYEGRHETSGHHRCRNAPRRRRGRHPTLSDECLVLVAPVSSDVFVWTADSLLHTHNWRMGKLRARRCSLEPRRNLRDTWTKLFKLCKTAEFPKTEFGTGNQIREDGEVTQVSLMRAHRE